MIAESINVLGEFCGRRDVTELTPEALGQGSGIDKADIFVLFGGSILCGGDVLASAIRNGIAKTYIISGGAGHTTESLRKRMNEEYPEIETGGLSEAEIFNNYIKYRYSLEADILETRSTNCGNNITFLLDLIKEKEICDKSIILSQDATMQHRMYACLRKYRPEMEIINYATYKAAVKEDNGVLTYESEIWGIWEMKRYISLLMGEIPRLTDDENGYGPKGKGFIAHVDIPQKVRASFEELKVKYPDLIRAANPDFAAPG